MREDRDGRIAMPLTTGSRIPPGGPPRAMIAAGMQPNPPRRYFADSTVQRRPWPLLIAWWLRDVVSLQSSLGLRAAVALARSLKYGQPCHPDWIKP
jgi:hypothetical protein